MEDNKEQCDKCANPAEVGLHGVQEHEVFSEHLCLDCYVEEYK